MSHPSFLIVGANFTNKGAEAMLKTVQHQILSRYPDADVYAICHEDEAGLAVNQGITPLYTETVAVAMFVEKVFGKLRKTLGLKGKPYADYTPVDKLAEIRNLKTAIDVSGFSYGDKRGYQQPLETIKVMDYCQARGATYLFMPQAWGSFEDKKVAANCSRMLTRAGVYLARDEVSRGYLAGLLKFEPVDIQLLPDIAFHFPIPELNGLELLGQYGFTPDPNKRKLAISPNMRVYERFAQQGPNNEYVKLLLNTIGELQQRYQVVLIPNETRPEGSAERDDAFLCKLIYDACPHPEGITLVRGYQSAEQVKAMIGEMDLLIASRFHSLIFAFSLGIPCMAISWSHKYRELFRLFDLEKFVLEDKNMGVQSVLARFKELEDEEPQIRETLRHTLPKLKAQNSHVFDLI